MTMVQAYEGNGLVAMLEYSLKKYDRIFLILDGQYWDRKLCMAFCDFVAVQHIRKKILVLLPEKNISKIPNKNIDCRQITKKEQQALKRLYCMYEFSDQFQLISQESQYGSLLRLVDTGILTVEEAFQALLYGIGGQTG